MQGVRVGGVQLKEILVLGLGPIDAAGAVGGVRRIEKAFLTLSWQ
jgi:hypothetical protein